MKLKLKQEETELTEGRSSHLCFLSPFSRPRRSNFRAECMAGNNPANRIFDCTKRSERSGDRIGGRWSSLSSVRTEQEQKPGDDARSNGIEGARGGPSWSADK